MMLFSAQRGRSGAAFEVPLSLSQGGAPGGSIRPGGRFSSRSGRSPRSEFAAGPSFAGDRPGSDQLGRHWHPSAAGIAVMSRTFPRYSCKTREVRAASGAVESLPLVAVRYSRAQRAIALRRRRVWLSKLCRSLLYSSDIAHRHAGSRPSKCWNRVASFRCASGSGASYDWPGDWVTILSNSTRYLKWWARQGLNL